MIKYYCEICGRDLSKTKNEFGLINIFKPNELNLDPDISILTCSRCMDKFLDFIKELEDEYISK